MLEVNGLKKGGTLLIFLKFLACKFFLKFILYKMEDDLEKLKVLAQENPTQSQLKHQKKTNNQE